MPATHEDAKYLDKEYRHTKDELNKATLTTKLKNIRSKYRKAVDSGRRSGHGRVVAIYFELCEKIWGGCPATTQIPEGIESTELLENSASSFNEETQTDADDISSQEQVNTSLESITNTNEVSSVIDSSTLKRRREQLDITLRTHRQAKMKKKLPQDAQLIGIATEELELKKKMLQQMEKMDEQHSSEMSNLASSLDKISNSIAVLSSLMGSVIPQQPHFYSIPQQPRPQTPINPLYYMQQSYLPRSDSPAPYSMASE